MIHREYFGFLVECDQCGAVADFDEIDREDWRGLMDAMWFAGWTKLKVMGEDGVWEHYCPECSGRTDDGPGSAT